MKLLPIVFFFTMLMPFCTSALNSEVVECYNCSHENKISSWGMLNLKVGDTKNITLVDIYNKIAHSYDVTLSHTPSLPGMPEAPMVTYQDAAVPAGISTMMLDLNRASNSLIAEAKSNSIPKSILSSPWEFVNCSYCRADVNDYLKNGLIGKISTLEATAVSIVQALNLVNSSVSNQFQIGLEAGGRVSVKLTAINSPIKLELEIINILDANNNKVLNDVTKLNNMNIKAESKTHVEEINSYLNSLGYGVNMNALTFSNGFHKGRITQQRFDYK